MKNTFIVEILGKKLYFSVIPTDDDLYRLVCAELQYDDIFDAEDLLRFVSSGDFQVFLADELRRQKKLVNRRIQVRVDDSEQAIIERRAIAKGYKSTSEYLRDLALTS